MADQTTCDECGGPLPYRGAVATPVCDACLTRGADADAAARDYLECPCCGDLAASGEVFDGQSLDCGCAGWISCDGEGPSYVALADERCPQGCDDGD